MIIPRFFTVALGPKYPKRPEYTLPDLELILTDKLEIVCPWPSNVPLNCFESSFPIGVKFDWFGSGSVSVRFLVSFMVYSEKSNGVVASLTKSESLISPFTSLTEMNVVLLSTFLLLYCNSLVPFSSTTFT